MCDAVIAGVQKELPMANNKNIEKQNYDAKLFWQNVLRLKKELLQQQPTTWLQTENQPTKAEGRHV
jgi:hypothetical protein